MYNEKTKDKLLEMIEEAVGYRVTDDILRLPHLVTFSQLIFNEEDTNRYNSLFSEIDLNSFIYEQTWEKLVEDRNIIDGPYLLGFEGEVFPFSFITCQWVDNLGGHLLIRVIGSIKYSRPAVFDVDRIAQKFFHAN
jgi:hypothetical protein